MTFSKQDHADLAQAAAILNQVMDRHPSSDLRVVSALCSSVQDIRLAERYAASPSKIGS